MTPESSFKQSTPAPFHNQTPPYTFLNQRNSTYDLDSLFNETTTDSCINQTNRMYDLVSGISAPTGLTYTLFALTCFFTLFGLCGNGLILISMWKLGIRSKGHGALITALAICDIVALISFALTQPCVHSVVGMDIRAVSTIVCKISRAIILAAISSSPAIISLICIERFLAVWFPLRTRPLLSEKNIFRAIWVCVTPIVLIFITMSVLYCEIEDGICQGNFGGTEYSTVLKRIPDTRFYNVCVGFILISSMLILSILTPLTIVKLYKQMVIRRRLTTSELNDAHFETSVKLIAVVIAHAILIGLPGIAIGSFRIKLSGNTLSGITIASLLNHSINFLLYNIFDSDFRMNIFALLGFTKEDRKLEQLQGSSNGLSIVGN